MVSGNKIKSDVIFAILNTLFTLVYPLITYPYVARVLMPEGLGQYTFVMALVEYFALVAGLGIPLYGTRTVASTLQNKDDLRKQSSSIFFINLLSTLVVALLYIGFMFFDKKAMENPTLYMILGLHIFSVALGVEWYFQGRAQFKYIAIRNGITKTVCIILIFIFVKSKDDIVTYAIIMIGSILAYSFLNFLIFAKEVKPTFKLIEIKKHLSPILFVFLIYLASKINTNLDTVMLNYLLGEEGNYAVGQYTAAVKVINIVVDLLVAVNAVLLPNISLMLASGKYEEAYSMLKKAFSMLTFFALPCVPGLIFVAKETILILSGEAYMSAIPIMMLMSINVVITALTNFFGVQVLYANNKEIVATVAIAIGAIINFTINYLLIPIYGLFGASIATIISNLFILIIESFLTNKYFRIKFLNLDTLKTIIGSFLLAVVMYPIYYYNIFSNNPFASLVFKMVIGVVVYSIFSLVLKNSVAIYIFNFIKQKFRRKSFKTKDN